MVVFSDTDERYLTTDLFQADGITARPPLRRVGNPPGLLDSAL